MAYDAFADDTRAEIVRGKGGTGSLYRAHLSASRVSPGFFTYGLSLYHNNARYARSSIIVSSREIEREREREREGRLRSIIDHSAKNAHPRACKREVLGFTGLFFGALNFARKRVGDLNCCCVMRCFL